MKSTHSKADIPFDGQAIGVIPARLASSRFPDKPLAEIGGVPMICWTLHNASKAKYMREVIVAAEDQQVVDAVRKFGGRAELVQGHFRSGSDRVAAAIADSDAAVVVNIQADEPFIDGTVLDRALELLQMRPEFGITTIATPIDSLEQYHDPNSVKVVLDRFDRCLYFSRASIPARHAPAQPDCLEPGAPFYLHIGVYCYRRSVLHDFVQYQNSILERLESLEQLRYLENGGTMGAVVADRLAPGVNTVDDLKIAETYIKEKGLKYDI